MESSEIEGIMCIVQLGPHAGAVCESSAMKEIEKKSLNDYNGKLIDYSIER